MAEEALFAASSRVEYTNCLVQTLTAEAHTLAQSITVIGNLYNELNQNVASLQIRNTAFSHWSDEVPKDAIIIDALWAADVNNTPCCS